MNNISAQPHTPTRSKRIIPYLMASLAFAALILRFAEPIKDGDFWWQIAYGKYMIENQTLIPDHTVFSWTPAINDNIYCAWLAEIVLYGLYTIGGLPLVFFLRYAVLSLFIGFVWIISYRLDLDRHPFPWILCILGLVMSEAASFIKPELFSYGFMVLATGIYFNEKMRKNTSSRIIYFLPLLMLVWVNSHGGVLFGYIFLLLIGLGEILNFYLPYGDTLPEKVFRRFLFILLLSALTILITPYGWNYCFHLISLVLHGVDTPTLHESIMAYGSMVDPVYQRYHFVQYFYFCIVIIVALYVFSVVKRKKIDYSLALCNLGFAYIYCLYVRSTYFWIPIFTMSALILFSQRPLPRNKFLRVEGKLGLILSVILCLFILLGMAYERICLIDSNSWFGFGIASPNPVGEAEFIQNNLPGCRLGNDYGAGGYLLWKLWPETRVFIDPRGFPFKQWFDEYIFDFEKGRDVGGFLARYPCDVWLLRYKLNKPIEWFLASPDWRLAYYGASAAIFVRKDLSAPELAPQILPEEINRINNPFQAISILTFSLLNRNFDKADQIIQRMQQRFRWPSQRRWVDYAVHLREGLATYYQRDYQKAAKNLEICRRLGFSKINHALSVCYVQICCNAYVRHDWQQAYSAAQSALSIEPENPYALYNISILEWIGANRKQSSSPDMDSSRDLSPLAKFAGWRVRLTKFLQIANQHPQLHPSMLSNAKEILEGRKTDKPQLARPADPVLSTGE